MGVSRQYAASCADFAAWLLVEWTHDLGRFITIGLWASTSLLCGLAIFGLTSSLALGCVAQLLTALALDTLRYEPMHPGALICFLVAGAATVPLLMPTRPRLAWTLAGALAGALAMSKINVGVFALLARRPRAGATVRDVHARQRHRPGRGGAVAVSVVFSALVLVRGTTIHGLVNAVLLAQLRHPDVLFRPLELAPSSRAFALLAAMAGVAIVLKKPTDAPWLRIAAGAAPWMAAPILPIRFGFYFAPLAWVAALPAPSLPDSAGLAFARRFLPLLAVLQTLHAYPVARSHVQWGAFMLVGVGAVCVFDGLRLLGRNNRFLTFAPAALLLLVAIPTVTTLGASRREYFMNEPLALPGADHVRLPVEHVSQQRGVVRMLQEHGCQTYIGAPGMGRFYFWTQREPPTGQIGTRWGYLFDRETQEKAVRDLESVDRLCVLERREVIAAWAKESPMHPSPLSDYLLGRFVPVYGDGLYRVYVRRGNTR